MSSKHLAHSANMAHKVDVLREHLRGVAERAASYAAAFDASDEAFLSDFGIAKSLHRSTGMTGTLFIGTPAYMSPEQVRNDKLDGRSDVYALGIVLYRALAGQLPYEKGTAMATAVAHITDPVPNILDIRPDLPSTWEEIISKVLAKAPADRYSTAGDLARDVREVASGRWYLRKLVDD